MDGTKEARPRVSEAFLARLDMETSGHVKHGKRGAMHIAMTGEMETLP